MDAAVHVGNHLGFAEPQVVDVVASLTAKSMVVADTTAHGMRYRMLETLRAFASGTLDADERAESAYLQADWVASLADTAPNEPCSAEVERVSIRLEREAEAWREAVVTATRLGSEELAGRLCGPPTAYFLLGRHDLGILLPPLLELCPGGSNRRAVLSSLAVSNAGYVDGSQLRAWAEEILAIDVDDPTGNGDLILWIALAWDGDITGSIQVAVDAATNEAFTQDTRDMFVGIATLDRFSLTSEVEDVDGLVPRALEVVARSEVASQRVSCLLGAAWAVGQTEQKYALALIRRALEEMPGLPAYMRRTLPGNASRLLMGLDSGLAARHVLEQIGAMEGVASFVDLIPTFYGAMLLQRVGHPAAGPAFATLAVSPVASYLVYVTEGAGIEGGAHQHHPVPLDQMVELIRNGLEAMVDAAASLDEPVPADELGAILRGERDLDAEQPGGSASLG
jgi:hypothetical protein